MPICEGINLPTVITTARFPGESAESLVVATQVGEVFIVARDSGEKRLIAWHNNFLRNKDGEIVGTLSSGEDITARKRAEEEVRTLNEDLEIKVEERTENLNAANKELKRFNNLFVGRELRIKELKARVKELEGKTSPPLNRSM